MKTTKLLMLIIVISLNTVFAQENIENASSFPPLEGPYLGQIPPGLTPEVFAPGLVSIDGRYEFGISFSSDLNEIYFSAMEVDQNIAIYYSKLKDKKWSPIKKADFTKGEKDTEMKPFVSLSENKIYFTAYNADSRNTNFGI